MTRTIHMNVTSLMGTLLAAALLAGAAAPQPAAAQVSKKVCTKTCKTQKKGCLQGFKGQFGIAKADCGSDKACKKTAKQTFKTNKKLCKQPFGDCKACCKSEPSVACSVLVCGDGNVVSGEECDDGAANADAPDACRSNCRLPACGDGIVDSGQGEQCEPPAAADCDQDCRVVETTTTTVTVPGSTSSSSSSTTSSSSTNTSPSSSSSTSSPVSTTTSTTGIGVCGDGETNGGETCDDGNVSNNDACSSDCVIDACTSVTGTSVPFEVHFAPPPGGVVGGIVVLVDYPEGKVAIPGPPIPGGIITNLPPGAFAIPVHLQHALRETVALGGVLPVGRLFRVNFRGCAEAGGVPPAVTEFGCAVLEATDNFSNPVSGVTCEVKVP